MNILLVEDEEGFASFLNTLLKRWGYRADWVKTGGQAVELASRTHYDLIFLDIFLPDGLGHDFAADLNHTGRGQVLVAMTGRNSPELEMDVRSKGISIYLIKPLHIEDVKALVDHVANTRVQYFEETKPRDPIISFLSSPGSAGQYK